MIVSKERKFILFSLTISIISIFIFSVSFTPVALAGQKSYKKGYSKSWKHKGSKHYGKQRGHSGKHVNGKYGQKSSYSSGKASHNIGVQQNKYSHPTGHNRADGQYKKQNNGKALKKADHLDRSGKKNKVAQYEEQNRQSPDNPASQSIDQIVQE